MIPEEEESQRDKVAWRCNGERTEIVEDEDEKESHATGDGPLEPSISAGNKVLSIHLQKTPAACLLQALDPFAKSHISVSSSFLHLFSNPLSRSTRNYFLAKEIGGSIKKSSHKLSDINLVNEEELREATAGIASKHEKEMASLLNSYKNLYSKWLLELRCGFSLLIVVVINGYLQPINIKHAVIAIAEVLWDQLKEKCRTPNKIQQPFNSKSMEDLLSFLDGPHAKESDCFIYVVVHNIDGPVWDKKMVHTQFNWCWYHVPTFAPYKVEGVFFPLILANSCTAQSAKTAIIVLQSLTPNTQSLFKVIAEYQIAHSDEEGIPMKKAWLPMNKLYMMCRERFLVSSQVTLNSHLTEFKDHELVKTRRSADGQDCFYIPLASEALEKLLQELG
ncbi:hypothetical protein AAC387_Pa07g1905 [Persea americana]